MLSTVSRVMGATVNTHAFGMARIGLEEVERLGPARGAHTSRSSSDSKS